MLKARLLVCLAAVVAVVGGVAAPAAAAIWVTLDRDRAPVGATVRAHAAYVGGEGLPLFLAPESVVEGRSQPLLLRVRGGVEVQPRGAPAFRAGMVPSAMLRDIEAGRANLIFVGELRSDNGEGGTLAFTVPDLPAATYRIVVRCESCASDGGSLLWGDELVIEPRPSSSLPWLPIGLAAGGALAAAAGAGVLARRRREGARSRSLQSARSA